MKSGTRFRLFIVCYLALILFWPNGVWAQKTHDINELIVGLKKELPDSSLLKAYKKVVDYYKDQDNDSVVYYAMEGLTVFEARGYVKGQGRMTLALADFSDTHGNMVAAEEKVNRALQLSTACGDRGGYADAINLYGVLWGKRGDYHKAIGCFIEGLNITDSLGDKQRVMAALQNVGLIYDFNKDTVKALEYYKRADSFASFLPFSENALVVYNNLGTYYLERGDTANAFRYFRKTLAKSANNEFMLIHVVALLNIGEIKCANGATTEGIAYLREALDLTRKHHLPDQEAVALVGLADYYADMQPDTCLSYLNMALALVQKTGNKPKELNVYEAMTKYFEHRKNYERANFYLHKKYELSDSLNDVRKGKEIAHLTAVYELGKSNEKVSELEQLVRKIRTQKVLIISTSLLMLVFVFVVLYYHRKTLQLNIKLAQGKDELAAMNNMKDKLFSVLGHDLRGPIANIPVILDMIEEAPELPAEYKNLLRSLRDHTIVTTETLDNLLLLGKSVMNGVNYIPVNFNPKPNILKNIDLLKFPASKKNIAITFAVPDDLGVRADPGHFDFILRNLISNAIKFSYTDSKIEVTAKRNEEEGKVLFSVRDYGTGISPAMQQSLFRSIVTSSYGTAHEKGNGIGLKLCEEFVRINGGEIWVESKEREGSTFYFTLPYFD